MSRFQKSSLNNPGLIEPGNINVHNRPVVRNPDGSISTVRSMSANFGKGETLFPTVVHGQGVSPDEAIDYYKQTGENLGTYDSPENADLYAQRLHEQQAEEYLGPDHYGQMRSLISRLLGGER